MSSTKGRGFDSWIEQEFEKLSAALDADVGADAEAWANAAREHASNIKEAGMVMKWELLAFVASCMSSLLEAIAIGGRYDRAFLAVHLNALKLAKHPRYRGMRRDQAPELTSALTTLSKRLGIG
jgi:hypothetical protein